MAEMLAAANAAWKAHVGDDRLAADAGLVAEYATFLAGFIAGTDAGDDR